ncbi:hypothetical protein HKD37_04G011579 [Glycine soja]|nr:hypothetical protein JHK87_010947 [Glycine soja]
MFSVGALKSEFLGRQPDRERKERSKKMEEEKGKSSDLVILSTKEETSVPALVCLRKEDIKRFEETEECFVLDFDPFHSLDFSKLSLDHQDVSILAEKGEVACRDYPHPRHLCVKFPFTATPHGSYCEMCYCYVCDSAAPCKYWNPSTLSHCDADSDDDWKEERNRKKFQSILAS